MRLIGKLDDMPVYEIEKGKYVIVNPEDGRWMVTWSWFGNFGKNFDTFMKCESCDEDEKCIEVIERNKDEILKRLNAIYEDGFGEGRKAFLEDQEEFYRSLDPDREFDYFEGYTDEE